MNQHRYSETQILCGMRELWERHQPQWFFLPRYTPFRPDDRIDVHLRSGIPRWAGEEIDFSDLVDLYKGLQSCFRFECTRQEWSDYFRLDVCRDDFGAWERLHAADFTYRRVAQFIAARATAISFEPVNVIGQEFGPGTRIRDVLTGNVFALFWLKVRWITEQRAPDLAQFDRRLGRQVLCIMLACISFLGVILFSLQVDASCYFFSAFTLIPLTGLVGWLMERRSNPLPPELQTFRDLAVWMSVDRSHNPMQ